MSQHEPDPDDPERIDTTDQDDAEVLLADPDDYHRAQRLREIHEARRAVADTLRSIDGYTTDDEHRSQRTDLAYAVTAYINELMPLMEATDYDDSLPDSCPFDTIREFAMTTGRYDQDGEYATASYEFSNLVFQEANRFLAEVKPLLEEDESDEWEV